MRRIRVRKYSLSLLTRAHADWEAEARELQRQVRELEARVSELVVPAGKLRELEADNRALASRNAALLKQADVLREDNHGLLHEIALALDVISQMKRDTAECGRGTRRRCDSWCINDSIFFFRTRGE